MRRDEILRDDFPTSRKGWEREAVTEHLEAVAAAHEALERGAGAPAGGMSSTGTSSAGSKLSTTAGEQIGRVVAAGEQLAAEIERAAREEAEGILERARGEAQAIRVAAEKDAAGERDQIRSESDAIVVQLREAVAQTVSEAEQAQQRVTDLADALGSEGTDRAKTRVPDSPAATEPLAAAEAAAPTPAAPDPADEPVLEAATEPAPEPTPEPESTPEPKSEPAAASAPASSSDQEAAARLVAMNLALEGAEAEQIKADLAADFGDVDDLDALVADVLARSGR